MSLAAAFTEAFFPLTCASCSALGESPFCGLCSAQNARLGEERCGQCGEPGSFDTERCDRCRWEPPPFSQAFAPFGHEGALARAIHRFKYEDHPELARPLASLWMQQAQSFLAQAPAEVCALPLHPRRFRQRRFDQAQLLAAELAELSKRTHLREVLVRIRETERQVGRSDKAREENVRGAFRAIGPLEGRRLLLVDDVLTTGATARSASLALLRAGAREVQVLTLARATLHGA